MNSATGEAIPRALVRTNGTVQRTTFSDSEGHFEIDGLPQSQVTVTAQKPGFFTDQDTGGSPSGWIGIGPNTSAIVVKLVPQAAVYGRITDSTGQPVENMDVRLTARSIREGRRIFEPRGMTETDEDGHYRFAGLMQGTYYVSAGPREGETQLLVAGEKQKIGFPHVYYAGVPDFASASPIQVSAGQQSVVDLSIAAVPVYQVSGSVIGRMSEQGVGFQVLTPSGDEISLPTNFMMESGNFTLDDVPGGTYLLRATSQSGLQPLRAEARISVVSNLNNVRLTLAPVISIPVSVRLDPRTSAPTSSATPQRPPVSVNLIAADGVNAGNTPSYEPGRSGMTIRNVDAGTYTIEVQPSPPWYVASASYGQTNVLYDDATVSLGQGYPLEIVLRDDSASVSGTVKTSNGTNPRATVVIIPQPTSKAAPQVLRDVSNNFTASGLAPGDYLIFAFDQVDGLEYANPEVIESYSSQAAQVTLTPGQKAQVSVDLIHVGKAD